MPEFKPLRHLIEPPVAGYWGSGDRTIRESQGAYVIRNGDAAGVDRIDPNTLPLRWFTSAEIARARCRSGDVVLVSSGEVGDAVALTELPRDFPTIVSNFVRRIRAAAGISPGWLGHVMRWGESKRVALRVSGGTTLMNLSSAFFDQLLVHVPREAEQQRIAEILDTIDEAIQTSERLIAKQRNLNIAVRRALLAPLSTLPRCRVGEKADVVVGIVIRPTQYYRDDGVPILRSANVTESGLRLDDLVFMSERDHATMSKSAVTPGDVLTVRTGYPGTTAVVGPDVPAANCVDLIITKTGPLLDPHFLSLWMNSDFGRGQVLRAQGGLAQQHFNVGAMKSLLVPNLPVAEQREVAGQIQVLSDAESRQVDSLQKTRALRVGLTADLLSGRTRTVPS